MYNYVPTTTFMIQNILISLENSLFPLCCQFPPFIVGFWQPQIGFLSLQFCFFSRASYKWNCTECTVFCLFFPLNAFEILSSCCTCQKFLYCQVLFHCTDITRVICSPVDGHLGCFQWGAIINKAAMNILFQSSCVGGHMFCFPRNGIAGLYG